MKIVIAIILALAVAACGSTPLKKAPDVPKVDIPKSFSGTININYNIAMDNSAISNNSGDACSDSGENLIGAPASQARPQGGEDACGQQAAKAVDGDNRIDTSLDDAASLYSKGLIQ
jgi:hypothetical protein